MRLDDRKGQPLIGADAFRETTRSTPRQIIITNGVVPVVSFKDPGDQPGRWPDPPADSPINYALVGALIWFITWL